MSGVIAFLWGLAEATLFFIVPDVWLSHAGRRDLWRGLRLCAVALAGALAGGVIMYFWGMRAPEAAHAAVAAVPAISDAMLAGVAASLRETGIAAMLTGPLAGIPYKTYAVLAHGEGIGMATFLISSIPARLIRFMLVTAAVHLAARVLRRVHPRLDSTAVLLGGWAAFYAVYLTVLPW